MRSIFMKLAVALLFTGISCLPLPAIAQETSMEPQKLVSLLREGGYVILVRHAAGDSTQKDAENLLLNDCKTQRNLSRQGRIDARGIGQSFDLLQIPVAKILSSPYCRAMDTGRFVFAQVERSNELNYVKDTEDDKRKGASLLTPLLSTVPVTGSNTVLITHSTNIQATLGFVPAEGEAIIFKPEGNTYKQIGRILAQQWSEVKP
jgi:phosphohistidine phosphatase SixA